MYTGGAIYHYVRNAQEDIVGLIDANGNIVVRYTYDSWGNIINISGSAAATIGAKNPFRYKGYYYDTETGLYYLQSRYYDPEIMRFISSDELSYLGENGRLTSYHLFTYCGNNPHTYYDPSGHFFREIRGYFSQ